MKTSDCCALYWALKLSFLFWVCLSFEQSLEWKACVWVYLLYYAMTGLSYKYSAVFLISFLQHCSFEEEKGVQCCQNKDKWSRSECWESPLYYRWWWWFCWSQREHRLWGSRIPRCRCLWGNKVKSTHTHMQLHALRSCNCHTTEF